MFSTLITIDAALSGIGDWSELTSRSSDGLTVALLWSQSTARVKVTVDDSKLDEGFELEATGADALAVFHHPFAFAAAGGFSFGDELRESIDLQLQS
jgi:phosphoribosylformylglycinamidine (FGAM) synthase-like amidotransferase family enzyme